jgi:hypothetical protein
MHVAGSIAQRAHQGYVCVSYVGGTDADNEWIAIDSGRLRKPQEDFAEDDDAAGRLPLSL